MKNNKKNTHAKKMQASILGGEKGRFLVIFFFFLLLFLLIFVQLWKTQVHSHEKYSDVAVRQHAAQQDIIAKRGTIYLADKVAPYPLAINREYFLAYLSPRDVKAEEREDVVRSVVATLDVAEADVRQKLQKVDDVYEVIKRKVSKDDYERIDAQNITGLHFLPETARFYPADSLAANVVGFVGSDGEKYAGRYGIEAYFEKELRGEHGFRTQETDARGGWLSVADRTITPQKDGVNIYLTIEQAVQQEVEKILAEDMEKYAAEEGDVIVMDPHTGSIIALATAPTFSPNIYGETEDISLFRNSVVTDTYEPGSVFKTFTIAAGLDAHKITPESTYTDTGSVVIGGWPIRNAEEKVYGLQTMTQVLEKSINTGVVHVERLVGHKAFKEYIDRFGFGHKTGITLPAEARGDLRNLSKLNRHTEYATASYGQGLTVTPLQLAVAYGALANGGMMMKPYIVDTLEFPDGTSKTMAPQVLHRVVSEEVSQEIGLMLEQVVVGGHAKLAAIPGYRVGGKTGTAQIVDAEAGGYADENFKNTTFVGYGPVDNPRFVVLVKYKNPQNVKWAATSAAPTFGRIAQFLFGYYGIAPTENSEI